MKKSTSSSFTLIDDAYVVSKASALTSSFYFCCENHSVSFRFEGNQDPSLELTITRNLAAEQSAMTCFMEK